MDAKVKPQAIIFDIDHTLIHITDKPWLEHEFSALPAAKLTDMLYSKDSRKPRIILVTARHERLREMTRQELIKCDVRYDDLVMNSMTADGKTIGASDYKYRVTVQLLEMYDIICAFENDSECAESYLQQGIPVFMPHYPI